jgi:hypothetical protein
MSGLSNYLENKLVDQLFRGQPYTFPATLHIGLLTSAPTDVGGGIEVAGGSYARVAVAGSLANFAGTQAVGSTTASTGTGGTTSNNIAINFPTPTAGWGQVTHFGIFDLATGGNLLFHGELTVAKTINQADIVSFPAGSLAVTFD